MATLFVRRFAAFLIGATLSSASAATSLSQFGITWSFDADYPTGRFANGDYWVVGPLTITRITPEDPNPDDAIDLHGSMVNPAPDVAAPYAQGWDSRVHQTTYNRQLNLARQLPLRLVAGSSLVTATSYPTAPTRKGLYLRDAAVLTVLANPPPEGSFRPPYSGIDKTIPGTVAELDLTIFHSLAPVARAPKLSSFDRQFRQPMIDIIGQWENSHLKNAGAGPNYGRDIAISVANAVLSLNLAYSHEEKLPLVIKIVQRGIDTYGLAKAGMCWFPNGGHNTGRKLPLLIAAKALAHAEMLEFGNARKYFIFQEDLQHWYIDEADVLAPRSASSMRPYAASMIGLAEWASDPIAQRHRTSSAWAKPYRIVNGVGNAGLVLAAEIMGLREEWNWEPLFHYIHERFLPIEGSNPTSAQTIPEFHRNLWLAYSALVPPSVRDRSQTASTSGSPVTPPVLFSE